MPASILSAALVFLALAGCGGSDGEVAAASVSETEGASAETQPTPSQEAPARYPLVLDRPFSEGDSFAIRVEITNETEGTATKGEETRPFSSTERHTVDAAAVVERVGPAGQRERVRYTIQSMEGTLDGSPLEGLPPGSEVTAEDGKALSIRVPGSEEPAWHPEVRKRLNPFLPIEESKPLSQERFGPPGPVAIGERWDVDGDYLAEYFTKNGITSPDAELSGWVRLDDVTLVGGTETALVTVHMEATQGSEIESMVSEITQQVPLDTTKHSLGRTVRAEVTATVWEEDVEIRLVKTVEIQEVWEYHGGGR